MQQPWKTIENHAKNMEPIVGAVFDIFGSHSRYFSTRKSIPNYYQGASDILRTCTYYRGTPYGTTQIMCVFPAETLDTPYIHCLHPLTTEYFPFIRPQRLPQQARPELPVECRVSHGWRLDRWTALGVTNIAVERSTIFHGKIQGLSMAIFHSIP